MISEKQIFEAPAAKKYLESGKALQKKRFFFFT